jgi:hypothetical protein
MEDDLHFFPEQLAARYALYLWPSSDVLTWYLHLEHQGAGAWCRDSSPWLLLASLGALPLWLTVSHFLLCLELQGGGQLNS